MENNFSLGHVEEEGFLIEREDHTILVYGTCEGYFTRYYSDGCMYLQNGDPGYPPEDELEMDNFSCWIDKLEYGDEVEGTPCDVVLTDEEYCKFESHMKNTLWKEAEKHG